MLTQLLRRGSLAYQDGFIIQKKYCCVLVC